MLLSVAVTRPAHYRETREGHNKSQIMKLDHEEWGQTAVEINHNLAETFT